MILQLHWQFKDGHTELCSQREVEPNHDGFYEWIEEIKKSHPLPEDAAWMMCNEKSKYFTLQAI